MDKKVAKKGEKVKSPKSILEPMKANNQTIKKFDTISSAAKKAEPAKSVTIKAPRENKPNLKKVSLHDVVCFASMYITMLLLF